MCRNSCCISLLFFNKPQLDASTAQHAVSCISLLFFNKPQLDLPLIDTAMSCISLLFFNKPQHNLSSFLGTSVVYLFSSSTSHNPRPATNGEQVLYISSLLQQATTTATVLSNACRLYISSLLQQATTRPGFYSIPRRCISLLFFNKPQPYLPACVRELCCISLLFFNKPQQYVDGKNAFGGCISLLFFNKPQLPV